MADAASFGDRGWGSSRSHTPEKSRREKLACPHPAGLSGSPESLRMPQHRPPGAPGPTAACGLRVLQRWQAGAAGDRWLTLGATISPSPAPAAAPARSTIPAGDHPTHNLFSESQGGNTTFHDQDSSFQNNPTACTPYSSPHHLGPQSSASWGSRVPPVTLGAPSPVPSQQGRTFQLQRNLRIMSPGILTPDSALGLPHPNPGHPLTSASAPLGCICLCFSS